MTAKKDEFLGELRGYFFPDGEFQPFWQQLDYRRQLFGIFERAYNEIRQAGEEKLSGQEIFDSLVDDISDDAEKDRLSRMCDTWREWMFAWEMRDGLVE